MASSTADGFVIASNEVVASNGVVASDGFVDSCGRHGERRSYTPEL